MPGGGHQVAAAEINRLADENRRTSAASMQVAAAVRQSIAATAPLVEKAQATLESTAGWGVVFGSDVSIAAARDEIARAERRGVAPAGVYFRNGYYASIAVVDSREKAEGFLSIVKEFRPDAYVAPMDRWCRNPQPREGFTECAGR